jgi:hypothetical protein
VYKKAMSFILMLSEPGFVCVPFSWAGCRVKCNSKEFFHVRMGKNSLFLSNHPGRIDWFVGMFVATKFGERVGFVMEYFIMLMPIFGWFRYLVEDMFVLRSFKQDKTRLDRNINGFLEAGVRRWMFFSPEGMIIDFSNWDKEYLRECENFCRTVGLAPFEMCLTPRYKGMTCFARHQTNGLDEPAEDVMSVTMSYVQDGELLTKSLKDDTRVIPDLWHIMKGGLEVDVHLHALCMSNDPAIMKEQLMKDQAEKDLLLKHFAENGCFPSAHPTKFPPPAGWELGQKPGASAETALGSELLEPDHIRMNASLFGQLFVLFNIARVTGNLDALGHLVVFLWVAVALAQSLGEFFQGSSRDSVPFEGLVKSLVNQFVKREASRSEAPEERA